MALFSASLGWQSKGPGVFDFGESFCPDGTVSSADKETVLFASTLASLTESAEFEVSYTQLMAFILLNL